MKEIKLNKEQIELLIKAIILQQDFHRIQKEEAQELIKTINSKSIKIPIKELTEKEKYHKEKENEYFNIWQILNN